jgi:hypothetical protein
LLALGAIAGLYLAVMLLFSFRSGENVLARGEEKYFCEIDCHLAYSVADVRETKTLGDAANQVTAAGTFRVVTVKTRFDETTIGASRGQGELYPNSRELVVIDERDRQYFTTPSGQKALEGSKAAGTPMTTPLRPGESYSTSFVFDLPADIRNPTLLIHEGEAVTHFIIGHENSPLHKTTRFSMAGQPQTGFGSSSQTDKALRAVSLIRRVVQRGRGALLLTARRGGRFLRQFAG